MTDVVALCTCGKCGLPDPGFMAEAVGETQPAAAAKPVWNLDQIIANMLRDKENWPMGSTIPFSFAQTITADSGEEHHGGFAPLTAEQQAFVRKAFAMVADIVPLNFVEVNDSGQFPNGFDKRIAFYQSSTMPAGVWGWADSSGIAKSGGGYTLTGSEIWFSTPAVNSRQWFEGGYNFMATMHEILHALGMPHPGNYNAGKDSGPITYAGNAQYMQDSNQYTVMSYFRGAETGANWSNGAGSYSPATLMLHDIAAMQKLYGANMNSRTGDTTYGFNSTAGFASYDFTLNKTPIFTIWDAGGTDVLDVSGYAMAQTIDLNQGAFSDVGGFTKNIAIALGVVVENARGGSAGDAIFGNAHSNRLEGQAGDDRINGHDNNDLLFGGAGGDLLFGDGGDDFIDGNDDGDFVLGGGGDDRMFGGNGIDLLGGEQGRDELHGGAGNDNIYGGAGTDVLLGNGDDDFIDGQEDGDFILGGLGADRVYGGAGSDQLGGEDGDDRLFGGEDFDNMYGGSGLDELFGESGGDFLAGHEGDDVLGGGSGADRLNGGPGSDRYLFFEGDTLRGGWDRIEDFFSGGDTIDVRFLDADTTQAGDQAFHYAGYSDSPTGAGTLRLGFIEGEGIFIFGYTDGDDQADFLLDIGTFNVSGSDFLL